jgi:hypothetical protein
LDGLIVGTVTLYMQVTDDLQSRGSSHIGLFSTPISSLDLIWRSDAHFEIGWLVCEESKYGERELGLRG